VIDRNDLERLLQDVTHDRAGAPVDPPDDAVLVNLRSQGRARRRRQSRRLVTTVAAVLVGGLLALTRMTASDSGSDRIDVIETPTTTTTPSSSTTVAGTTTSTSAPSGSPDSSGTATRGPAIGARAINYVGIDITAENDFGEGLSTSEGQPLGYLGVSAHPSAGGRTILMVGDGDLGMIWLLSPGWPANATVLDAVDGPDDHAASFAIDCTSTDPTAADAEIVAAVDPFDRTQVSAAWTITPTSSTITPLPTSTPITCPDSTG
jgi:hypothetical protein